LIERLKGRWQPFALLAVFTLPTAAAMMMVFSDWRPDSFTNNGDLVQPAEAINPGQWQGVVEPAPVLAGDWLIVTPQRGDCAAACRERVDQLNRAQIALDRDIERVRLVVLQPESRQTPVFEPVPGILNLAAADAQFERLARHDGEPMAAHIVDYRGYHVMRYPQPLDASGLLDDLENLLSLAKEEAERRALEEAVEQ